MNTFIQHLPWEGFAKRTLTLEEEKLIIDYRSPGQNLTDDIPYGRINPDIRLVRRGATEWSNVVFGLVIAMLAVFVISKMSRSMLVMSITLVVQLCIVVPALVLVALIFIKKEYIYVLDDTGECLFSLRATPKAKTFIGKMKERMEKVR
jgi:hypothetical protein